MRASQSARRQLVSWRKSIWLSKIQNGPYGIYMMHLHEVITRQPCRQKQQAHEGILPFILEYIAVRVCITRFQTGIVQQQIQAAGRWGRNPLQTLPRSLQHTHSAEICLMALRSKR